MAKKKNDFAGLKKALQQNYVAAQQHSQQTGQAEKAEKLQQEADKDAASFFLNKESEEQEQKRE